MLPCKEVEHVLRYLSLKLVYMLGSSFWRARQGCGPAARAPRQQARWRARRLFWRWASGQVWRASTCRTRAGERRHSCCTLIRDAAASRRRSQGVPSDGSWRRC